MGGTRLLVTPAQHRADDLAAGTSVLRKYTGLDLRLYYSDNITATALSAAPTIVGVNAVSSGGGVTFSCASRRRSRGGDPRRMGDLHRRRLPERGLRSRSRSARRLRRPCAARRRTRSCGWGSSPSAPANLKYIVQAVNGVGLVSLDDNLGAYYSYAGAACSRRRDDAHRSVPPPTTITYGQTPAVTATLTLRARVPSATRQSPSRPAERRRPRPRTQAGSARRALPRSRLERTRSSRRTPAAPATLPSTASSPLTVNPAQSLFIDDSVTVAPAAFLVAPVGPNPLHRISRSARNW